MTTLSKDAQDWLESQSNEFMVPVAEQFDVIDLRDIFDEEFDADVHAAGWYARLSAPGYMDATEWCGPYASEDEALEALYELYGDD